MFFFGMNVYIIPYLEHQRPCITSPLLGDMKENGAGTDKPFWSCRLQSCFQGILYISITGLDRGYYSCTVIPSKIYMHTQVCGKHSSKVHGHFKVITMYPLKHMHTNNGCYRRLQKECVYKTSSWLWVSSTCMNSQINISSSFLVLERKSEMRLLLNKFSWKCLYFLYVLSIISNGHPWSAGGMFIKGRTSGKFSW